MLQHISLDYQAILYLLFKIIAEKSRMGLLVNLSPKDKSSLINHLSIKYYFKTNKMR